MVGHMSLLQEFTEASSDLSPGSKGLEDCEGLLAHLGSREAVSGKYLVRRFLGIRQFLGINELDSAYWHPGAENPADRLTEGKADTRPFEFAGGG